MRGRIQEKVDIWVPERASEGTIPGRSLLRTRDLRQLAAVRLLTFRRNSPLPIYKY